MGFFSTLLRRSDKRRAYASLLDLDDHLLRDIGVTRSDLRAMMAETRTTRVKSNGPHG